MGAILMMSLLCVIAIGAFIFSITPKGKNGWMSMNR